MKQRLPLLSMGFNSWSGSVAPMNRPHRHNEIELNLIEQGYMVYMFGGDSVAVDAGCLALFWAAFPHQVVETGEPTVAHWLTLPLRQFLAWQLDKPFTDQVLNNQVIVEQNTTLSDLYLFRQWHHDMKTNSEEHRRIMLLEVEARVRRLARSTQANRASEPRVSRTPFQRVEQIASYIAQHYTEVMTIPDIASAVGLHPTYAMTIFREHYNMSILECVTQYRVAHAQRLLVTTDLKMLDIAQQSGFGSLSRFYAAFKNICQQTPAQYRGTL